MFWPIVLPFQLTCLLLAVATCAVVWYAPRRNWKRSHVFFACIGMSFLLFVPACIGIGTVADHFRFGRFSHSNYDQINDFRVQRYMPPAASNVDVDKYASGFRARYEISPDELDQWIDGLWQRYGDVSAISRDELEREPLDNLEYTSHVFDGLPWQPKIGCEEISGPVAGNGAGFTVWYNRSDGIAYERAGYW